MMPGPGPPLEIHVHVSSGAPQRLRLPVWWLLLIPLWPMIWAGWLLWFGITCVLTLAGS
jgi:hypothetical protein